MQEYQDTKIFLLNDIRIYSKLARRAFVIKRVKKKFKLVAKVNNIDIGRFVLKTKYHTDKSDLEKKISVGDIKIPDTS